MDQNSGKIVDTVVVPVTDVRYIVFSECFMFARDENEKTCINLRFSDFIVVLLHR